MPLTARVVLCGFADNAAAQRKQDLRLRACGFNSASMKTLLLFLILAANALADFVPTKNQQSALYTQTMALHTAAVTATCLGAGYSYCTIAKTGSMRPAICDNAVVVLEGCDYSQLRVGDVVVYVDGGNRIAHRLIAKKKNGFIARGDNNPRNDVPLVTRANFVSRVVVVFNVAAE